MKKITITVPLKGGLGNQMFGYAYCRFLEKKGYSAQYSWREFLYTKNHNGFELNKVFNIKINKIDELKLKSLIFFNPLFEKSFILKRLLSGVIRLLDITRGVYLQKTPFSFDDTLFSSNTISNGFWQNYQYIQCINPISRVFEFKIPQNHVANNIDRMILDCDSIGVHIRRGDYLKKEFSVYNVLSDSDYYHNAIDYFNGKNSFFFIFSDDIEWCKKQFIGPQFHFVDCNHGVYSYLDMYLMSHCKHLIISNSTFSWWAAVLNNHDSIIAPKLWTRDGVETEKFSPNSWIYL